MEALHLPDNIKVHFAGMEQLLHYQITHTLGVNYFLYTAYPFVSELLKSRSSIEDIDYKHLRHLSSNCVVNCFQISNFVLWQTARWCTISFIDMLWIAFKLVILSYDKQRLIQRENVRPVVNCFQISNFVLWQTAQNTNLLV